MNRSHSTQAFTMMEMLIVIAMVATLIGIAVPVISVGMERANQARDLNHLRQVGLLLTADATEHGGSFRIKGTSDAPARTSTEIFRGLIEDGLLKSPEVLSATGVEPAKDTNSISANNVAWEYVLKADGVPLTLSDANMPLLISYGAITSASLQSQEVNITGKVQGGTSERSALWGEQGILVYYVSGKVEWIRAKNGVVRFQNVEFDGNPVLKRSE